MNKLLAAALIAASLSMSSCAGDARKAREARDSNPAPCPNVVVLTDAARILEFDGEASLDNIAYTGEIVDVSTVCRYYGDKPIDVEISIDFAFGKGPKGSGSEKVFTYFVAVTRKDMEVITKNEFAMPINFSDNGTIETKRIDIENIVIPRKDEQVAGDNFEIVVGFKMSAAQVGFNRSGKSLKFPELK